MFHQNWKKIVSNILAMEWWCSLQASGGPAGYETCSNMSIREVCYRSAHRKKAFSICSGMPYILKNAEKIPRKLDIIVMGIEFASLFSYRNAHTFSQVRLLPRQIPASAH